MSVDSLVYNNLISNADLKLKSWRWYGEVHEIHFSITEKSTLMTNTRALIFER